MKVTILCVAALVATAPAAAQIVSDRPDFGVSSPGYVFNQSQVYTVGNSHYTPTMRRQDLAQAIALREEAAALLSADGGTLTPKNKRYIRRKAERILDYER